MRILAIWPHPDDIELNCFWTLCKLKDEWHEINMLVLSDWGAWGNSLDRVKEQQDSASLIWANLYFWWLKDKYISEWYETIEVIEKYVNGISPDIVFIPSKYDTHQDHRAVSYASLVACRWVDNILQYNAISSWTEFKTNYFVDITNYIEKKIKAIKSHKSQSSRRYTKEEIVIWRGKQVWYKIHKSWGVFEEFTIYKLTK